MKPIFNIDVLKEACTFEIHEDVALNEVVIWKIIKAVKSLLHL
jgi:hypothetical protein